LTYVLVSSVPLVTTPQIGQDGCVQDRMSECQARARQQHRCADQRVGGVCRCGAVGQVAQLGAIAQQRAVSQDGAPAHQRK
jgi:hypothetical protein